MPETAAVPTGPEPVPPGHPGRRDHRAGRPHRRGHLPLPGADPRVRRARGLGLNSCAHWLNWQCGIDLGAAREKVRVAHALKDLPRISEAFRAGRLSYAKVRAMTRVATPDNEDYLLMTAHHGTASHVERLVRGYRQVKRAEALAQENDRCELRELARHLSEDGSLEIKARLTPEQGARVVAALNAALDAGRAERPDVSAETSSPSPPATSRTGSPSAPERPSPTGTASRWMTTWRSMGCCELSEAFSTVSTLAMSRT